MKKIPMTNCPNCGHSLPQGALACPFCSQIFEQEDWSAERFELTKMMMEAEEKKRERRYAVFKAVGVTVGLILIFGLIIGFCLFMGNRSK